MVTLNQGLTFLGAQFIDISRKWRMGKLFPCSTAFLQEKVISNESNFSYPLSYLNGNGFRQSGKYNWGPTNTLPVVRLDWRIGSESCSQAPPVVGGSGSGKGKGPEGVSGVGVPRTGAGDGGGGGGVGRGRGLGMSSGAFACQGNSECVDVDFDGDIQGYRCRCLIGYEGNPYLAPGCRDIDECADNSTEKCQPNSVCMNTPGSFNCSCLPGYFGDGRLNGFGCKELSKLVQLQTVYRKSKKIGLAIGLGSGIGFLLLLLTCFWLLKVFLKRKEKMRKEKFFKENGGLILQQKVNEGTIRKTKHFLPKELDKATDHFNENRILGQGGQGTVYKGMLTDGKIVAIKKSKKVNKERLDQFVNEIAILSHVNHRNVVKLLGCCLEDELPLLVYEFVPNGTLSNLIHGPDNQNPISWNTRLKIVADIADALAYLHFSCSIPIYHRDIKSSNILLDEKHVVKVSDFGISKLVEEDKTHLTTLVKGSFGYLDPEYFQSQQFTDKSDVYSFGVVLVELMSGQRPISSEPTEDGKSLATRFLESVEEHLDSILDPIVKEQGQKEEVIKVARLAQRCLNLNGKMRPTMKEVATELANYSSIAQMSSNVEDESEGAYETKPVSVSDIQYTWTTSNISEISSSSDTHPFMLETV